jgi:hypothetical protein
MTPRGIAIGIGAALLLAGGTAWAGKPGGGGGGGPVDTGTIYYTIETNPTHVYSMNADGSGKAVLPIPGPSAELAYHDASHVLHGGHRWLLARMRIVGETTPQGGPRFEAVALRDDGVSVRLTYSGDFSVSGMVRWSPDDARVAYFVTSVDSGGIRRNGVAIADVTYDASGNVTGLVATPAGVAIPDTTYGTTAPSLTEFDWSPDGTQCVLTEVHSTGVIARVVDLASSGATVLPTDSTARDPKWSPDGQSISYVVDFNSGNPTGVRMIAPNGTNDRSVFAATTSVGYASARWSPSGVNLALEYATLSHRVWSVDVGRALPTGGTVTNLTTAVAERVTPFAWR